ncbi:MAG: O-antigen ligase family protein [Gemmatimonadota bacterium]
MRLAARGWRTARWNQWGEPVLPATPELVVQSGSPVVAADPPLSLKVVFPTFGVGALLVFCFVIISNRVNLGAVAALASLAAPFIMGRALRVPGFIRAYLGYVALATLGLFFSPYREAVQIELELLYKVAAIGLAACTILTTRREVRGFVFGYLAIFALFPVRGALFNYVYGITEFGRISWNFIFANPNALAALCFLPLGMSGYFLLTERRGIGRLAALAGLVILTLIILLTQSRGAFIGLILGFVYFVATAKQRGRGMLFILIGFGIAAALAPSSVWDRLGGLSNASVTTGMKGLDQERSAESRWAIMGIGVGIARDNPVFGVGIGAYEYEHLSRTQRDRSVIGTARGARDAHSTYIRAAAETGFFGFICIAAFIGLALLETAKIRRRLPDSLARERNALLALEVSLVAFAGTCMFGSMERVTFFLLQAIIPWVVAKSLEQTYLTHPAARRA